MTVVMDDRKGGQDGQNEATDQADGDHLAVSG